MDSVSYPTSYREIIRLAKRMNIKLSAARDNIVPDINTCVLGLLARSVGKSYYEFTKKNGNVWCNVPAMTNEMYKLAGLECGFEKFNIHFPDNPTFMRYYKVGERLRSYANANS